MTTATDPVAASAAHFVGDFLNTFLRLLDPNLPVSPLWARDGASGWPAGQMVAFGTICTVGVGGLLTAIFSFIA